MLKKQNVHLKQYGKKTVRMALEETKYEPVLTLFTSRNFMLYSEEPHVTKLLKLKKRMPQFILMSKYARWMLCFFCTFQHISTSGMWFCFFFFLFFKRRIAENFLGSLAVKMKALWSFEMSGIVCTTTQPNTLQQCFSTAGPASIIPGRERFSWNLSFWFSKQFSWINVL